MRIAFYAPLKSPDHPVVSGDREMARLLMRALEYAGNTVNVASELRAYLPRPEDALLGDLARQAEAEVARLATSFQRSIRPDLWFTYHSYYKSPDLIGPRVAAALSIPYVTAEVSYSRRKATGAWAIAQEKVAAGVSAAAVNLCFTRRDHDGLAAALPQARLALLPPFIDLVPFQAGEVATDAHRLISIGMMRPGDKLDSYRMLAGSLKRIRDLSWTLSIIGDGPCRGEVEAMFGGFADDRIQWHGRLETPAIAGLLREGGIYVWPGCGEAFGLAYLEAQASGLPVVAQDTAGVPEVVTHGETGLLTPAGDGEAYATAIARLLDDESLRRRLGENARRVTRAERSLEAASRRLAALLPQRTAA